MDRISRIKELLNVEEFKEMKSFQNKWLDEGRYIGQISIAKVMLKAGKKIEKIISYTGLSKQEIEGL